MPRIFFDIETIPGEIPPPLEGITPDGRLKDPNKLLADLEKKQADRHRQQSLHALRGRVCAIGWAVEDEEPQCLVLGGGESEFSLMCGFERALMERGHYEAEPWTWVGHNAKSFDAHWLWLRAKKYGLSWLYSRVYLDRFKGNVVDTMELAATGDLYNHKYSLSDLVMFFAGESAKDGMDGSMVWDAWQAGEHGRIAAYCKADVENARSLYRCLTR